MESNPTTIESITTDNPPGLQSYRCNAGRHPDFVLPGDIHFEIFRHGPADGRDFRTGILCPRCLTEFAREHMGASPVEPELHDAVESEPAIADTSALDATDLRGVTWMGRPVSDLRVEFSAGDLSPPFQALSPVEKAIALSALRLSALGTEHGSCSWARDPGSSGYGITATELFDGSMRLTLRFCPDFEARLSQLRAEFDPDRGGRLTDVTS